MSTAVPVAVAAVNSPAAGDEPVRLVPRVLIVDDRPDNLLALRAVLEPLALDVVEADSGTEALRQLLSPREDNEFALLILDVQMPVLDGFETARLIRGRERTRHVPIIFLTAISGEPEHYRRGYGSGAVDYVYKPFEPEILRAKVSVFADLWTRGATIERQKEELAAKAAELERSNAALERFAAVASHDIRGPLHTVAGLLDLLDERHRADLGDEARMLLDRAVAGTDRTRAIVAALLDYARVTTGALHRERVPLGEALAEAEAALALGERTPEIEGVADGFVMWGDRGQLVSVLTQLLDNAARFSDGTAPRVRVAAESTPERACRVSVTDDGPGVPEADLALLFTVFAPPARPDGEGRRGADIGLALCRRIVEHHGGTIWAENAAGGGVVVRFELPGEPVGPA